VILACDFVITVTARFRVIYAFVVLEVGTRRIVHWNVTEHPTADWTIPQFRSVMTPETSHRFVDGTASAHNARAGSTGERLL
jgi:putative transposase